MSSYTKSSYITYIKSKSALLASFTDAIISTFIDSALIEFSRKTPEIRIDADNAFSSDDNPVDLPDDCLDVYSVRDSDSEQSIVWNIVNEGDGDKLELGIIALPSYQYEIEQEFYIDPLILSSVSSTTFDSYDIEYSILQTMSTIKNTYLEALFNHILYQACSYKAEQIAMSAGSQEQVNQLSVREASGESVETTFASSKESIGNYQSLADSYLKKFNDSVGNVAFGVRS